MPSRDGVYYNKKNLEGKLLSALGGRIAEDIIYGNEEITTGCGSDLVKATGIAYHMARRYGMLDENYIIASSKEDLSDQGNLDIDRNVQTYLKEQYNRAKKILLKNKWMLDKLAYELVKKETMSCSEVKQLLSLN